MSKMTRELIGRFIDAAVQDHSMARHMLRQNPDLLDARYLHGETVIHFLAVEGLVPGVQFLAEVGAAVDLPNRFGDTALVDVATLCGATGRIDPQTTVKLTPCRA